MKRIIKIIILFFAFSVFGCGQNFEHSESGSLKEENIIQGKDLEKGMINPEGITLQSRILPPKGFVRVSIPELSFEQHLRKLPLKPHQSKALFYNGKVKSNPGIYIAVADLKIGNKDLHQCADAIIRLRAEYLWERKRFEEIHFNFTNGFRVDYQEWMLGKRVKVNGNNAYWTNTGTASNTYDDLWRYLETVFTYAGTLSLSKELRPVSISQIQIGDIFIQGGSPGHAVIVVDMAVNKQTHEKVFMLAQSYMPAQEIQILQNPKDEDLSPWYSVEFGEQLVTPEWVFRKSDLKRFDQ